MKTAYLLYEGDCWLSRSSLVLMGVFTTKEKLFSAVKEYVVENKENFQYYDPGTDCELAKCVLEEFIDCGQQTQGYDRNLLAKEIHLNELGEI